MPHKDADEIANSEDPNQTAPLKLILGLQYFAKTLTG